MHIRFNRALRGDYGRARPGDVKLVTKEIGKRLVQRGLAVQVEAPDDAEDDEAKAARLEAQLAELTGKSAEEVKAAHSGPELRALLAHLKVEVAPNATKAGMSGDLVEALTKRGEAEAES